MSYQGVVNIIRGVSVAVNPTGFFQHGRTWDASLNFDEGDPQIYLYPLQNTVDESNSYFEAWTVAMGFFYQDAQDSTVEQREAIMANADNLVRTFLATITLVEGIEISGIRTEPRYRQMAGTYSGMLLSFTLGATSNVCSDEADPDIPNVPTFCDKVDDCLNIPTEDGNYVLKLLSGVKSWVTAAAGGGVWGSITGTLSDQTDLQNALDGKQDDLGYTPEDVANKATTMSGNTASNTVYLTAKAVYDYLVATYQTIITPASWGSFINGLTDKATPVDADMFAIADSADSNTAKKLTWANLKATLAALLEKADASYYRKTGASTFELWYTNGHDSVPNMAATRGKDFLIFAPWIVPKAITLDRLGVEVTGAGTVGSVMRIGIYNSSNCVPTSLILDAGTINTNSATFQSIVINQTLQPGLYFFAYNHNSTSSPGMRLLGVGASPITLGFTSAAGANQNLQCGRADTYGVGYTLPASALPDTLFTSTPIAFFFRLSA
jgi:hypothetical protein